MIGINAERKHYSYNYFSPMMQQIEQILQVKKRLFFSI